LKEEEKSVDWLRKRAPGYGALGELEQSAINEFALLWGLFEGQILETRGSANKIIEIVDRWLYQDDLNADAYDDELAYFRKRYFKDGDFTYHFGHLNLRQSDCIPLVRSVIDGSNRNPRDWVAAIFIIIMRYRNNLFHGLKWQYQLAGQLDNFSNANSALKKALEQHGQLNPV